MLRFGMCIIIGFAVAGCIKTNPDPSRGGLLNGFKGLQGGYDKRIEDLREELAAEEAAQNS